MSKTQDVFDVLVVGSGASGGWAAKRLAEAGVEVALVDCGRPHGDETFSEHTSSFSLKYRDRAPDLSPARRWRSGPRDRRACRRRVERPYASSSRSRMEER